MMRRLCILYVGLALSAMPIITIYLLHPIIHEQVAIVSWKSPYPFRFYSPHSISVDSDNYLPNLSLVALTRSASSYPVALSNAQQTLNIAVSPVLNNNISSSLASRFPHVMIVGFGKAGTKALFEYLKQHPQLSGPEREMRFFSQTFDDKGLKRYLSALPPPPSNGFVIEKSPDYIITAEAPHRIVTSANSLGISGSELKFIVVLRNPINRAMSEYLECDVQQRIRREPLLPLFEEMVRKSSGDLDVDVKFINTSCYEYHLRRWFTTFPSNQVCYVDGDDFIIMPFEVMHRLEACLKLRPFFVEDNFHLDPLRGFYCYREYDKRPLCMGRNKGRPHPPIQKSVYHKLVQYFKKWDRKLNVLTELNFSWFNGY